LIGGIWYLKNIGSIIELFRYRFFVNQTEISKYNLKLFSLQYFSYYLSKLLDHIGVFYWVLLLLALFIGLFKKNSNEKNLLFSAFLIPYIIIALIPLKEHIIQISLYYTIAIIIAGFIFEIKNSKIKRLLLLLIFVYAVSVISSQIIQIPIHNLIIKDNKLQLVRTKDTSRLLNPPVKELSIMEQSFLYTQNTSHNRFLVLSNDHTHFWDFMYFRNIHKHNYVIYEKFRLRDNKYNKWAYNTKVKGGFILDFNISDIINNGEVEYLLVFLPKNNIKDSFKVYAPSFEGIKIIENSNKYELIQVIQGNTKTPEEANQIIQIYRVIN